MALKLTPPRKANPNYAIRGSYLHVKKLYRSTGAPEREVAEQVLDKIKRDIERGFFTIEPEEIWRKIPDCAQYEVSNLGHVRRRSRGHRLTVGPILKPRRQHYGHLSVSVYRDDGSQWRISVHRLVALAFIGPAPSSNHVVCHKNGYAEDCRLANLYWGTWAENVEDMKRHRKGRVRIVWNSDPYDKKSVKTRNIKAIA